jgi:hypothetical protein
MSPVIGADSSVEAMKNQLDWQLMDNLYEQLLRRQSGKETRVRR